MAKATARVVGLVAVILAAILSLAYGMGLFQRQLTVAFVVPDDYTGYLVTRWECPGGIALEWSSVGGWQDATVEFDAQGAACIADSIPRQGFRVGGFRFGDGTEAPVIVGGSRGLDRASPAGEADYVFSPVASIGVGNGQILGDECSLREFLAARFGVPARANAGECEPIYVLPNPALSATPGLPAGPD